MIHGCQEDENKSECSEVIVRSVVKTAQNRILAFKCAELGRHQCLILEMIHIYIWRMTDDVHFKVIFLHRTCRLEKSIIS